VPAAVHRGRAVRAAAAGSEGSGWPRSCIASASQAEAQESLRRHYLAAGDQAEYTRTTAILADAFPFTGPLQFDTAAALIAIARPADALRYARRAADLEPRNVNTSSAAQPNGRQGEARPVLERVLELEPGNPTAREVLPQLGGG
jgi:hypothetical protein